MPALRNEVECSACGEVRPATYQEHYPDDGWVLPFDTFGYDGGFADNFRVLLGREKSREWIMCHDCVVKFLETFPRLAEELGRNLHTPPRHRANVACCRHAWRATEYFSDFKPRPNGAAAYQTAWPDGVWHDDPESIDSEAPTMEEAGPVVIVSPPGPNRQTRRSKKYKK